MAFECVCVRYLKILTIFSCLVEIQQYVPEKMLQSLMNYGLRVLNKNQGSYQEGRFRDLKKVSLEHMHHVLGRVEEERSLVSKEEMEEEEMMEEVLEKEDLFLKEREICQKFNL